MYFRSKQSHLLSTIFWVLAAVAVIIWGANTLPAPGWDLNVYRTAIHSMQSGDDPYADGIAAQRAYHATPPWQRVGPPPFTYVYSPLTLPLLRWIGRVPLRISGALYWLAYAAGLLTAIWTALQAVEETERPAFRLLAPAAAFFPGLLQSDVLFSGNVAYLLYGAIFGTAVVGWRSGKWGWFYAATLAASCCKAPMLSLVLIAPLSARGQWRRTVAAGAAGILIFALQPVLWPALFRNYLTAVELQFSFNRDFSCSPAGVVALMLFDRLRYSMVSATVYVLYAVPVFYLLIRLSRKFLAGEFSIRQWIPFLLVGVVLLNPRIMEYDVAPLALPLILVIWRFFGLLAPARWAVTLTVTVFLAFNAFAWHDQTLWRSCEGLLLLFVFAAGAWTLSDAGRRLGSTRTEPVFASQPG